VQALTAKKVQSQQKHRPNEAFARDVGARMADTLRKGSLRSISNW